MTIGFVTTGDGCRLAYAFHGPQDAPVLLLSNSLGTRMDMWDQQLGLLAARFRVLRYDSRGHGKSGAPAGGYSLDRLGRDVIELLDTLGLDRVDFCGLSLGGMVGQWLAVRAPERFGRVVLANTSAYMGPASLWDSRIATVRENGMRPLAEASISRWFTPPFAAARSPDLERIRAGLLATDPTGYAGCCAAIRDMDMRKFASLNTLPTLIIAGARDPATPIADGAFLADAMLHAELVEIDAAHLSNVERPKEFAIALLDFL